MTHEQSRYLKIIYFFKPEVLYRKRNTTPEEGYNSFFIIQAHSLLYSANLQIYDQFFSHHWIDSIESILQIDHSDGI